MALHLIKLAVGCDSVRELKQWVAERMATAKKKGLAKKEVDAAEKYLKDVMDFCSDDFHFMGEIETFTYNGGPERWGDDWFYDRWRGEMRNHTLAILKAMGPLVADKK